MKKFLIISGVVSLVLISCFLVINSGFFVKRVVIPMAESSLGTKITIDDVDFSIFKGIQLINLKVEADATQPSPLNADTVRIRYRFLPLLKGKIQVDEVLLENVSIHVTEDKNGILNIPGSSTAESDNSPPDLEEKEETVIVPQFDIRNVKINNLSLVYEREARDNSPKIFAKVFNVSFFLDKLAPGEAFKIDSLCSLSCKVEDQVNASSERCRLTANGLIREDFFPGNLNLIFAMEGIAGSAGPVTLDDRVVNFEFGCEGDGLNYQLKRCDFSEVFQGNVEGHGTVRGEIGIDSLAANLELEIKTVGPGFLNLVGGLIGDYNFGDTEFHYAADLKVMDKASSVSATGDLKVSNFSINSEGLGLSGLKPINSSFSHNITYDHEGQLVHLRKVDLLVTDEERELMTLVLSEPTVVSLKQTTEFQNTEATLNLDVKDFNLELFKPFIPKSMGVELQQGILNQATELKVYDGGERLELNGTASISDLSLRAANHDYSGLELQKSYTLKVNDFFSELIVERLKTTGLVNGAMVYDFNALASIDLANMIGTAKIGPITVTPDIGSLIPENLLEGYEITNINSNGNFEIILGKNDRITIEGGLKSDNIAIHDSKKSSKLSLSPSFDLDAMYTADGNLKVNRCSLNLGSPQEPPCKVDLTGRLNTSILEGDLVLDVKGIAAPLLDVCSRFIGLDFYFGNTQFDSVLTIQIENKGNDLAFNGEFSGADITLESSQLGLKPLRPLNLSVLYGGKFLVSSTTVNMDNFSLYVDEQNARVISTELDQPAVLTMMPIAATSANTPAIVRFSINDLHLDLVEPLIPKGFNLDVNNGRLNSELRISIADGISQILCVGNIDLVEVLIPSSSDAENKTDSILAAGCKLDVGYTKDAMVKISEYTITLDDNSDPLVQMAVEGNFDASMTGKPSVLSLTSLVPIQAKRLQQVSEALIHQEPNTPPQEEEVGESTKDPKKSDGRNEKDEMEIVTDNSEADPLDAEQSEMLKLDIEINIDIPELKYDKVIISDCKPTVLIRENKVTIDPFTFNVNAGSGRLGVSCDFKNLREPTSAGNIELSNIDLQPIADSVSPEYSHFASGTLKNLKSSFETTGATTDDIIKSIKADTNCEFINIDLAQSLKSYTTLIRLLSGGTVKENDLVFDLIRFEGHMDESLLSIAEASFTNPNLRILSNGEFKYQGYWVGEVGVTPGYAGELVKLVEKNNFNLEKGDDDFFYSKRIPLNIDTSKDAKTLLKEWLPSVADNLLQDQFGLEGKAIKDGVKSLGGVLSGKTSVKDAIKGGLGIFENFKKEKKEEGNPKDKDKNESKSQEDPEDEKNEVKDFLKSLW